MLSEYQLKIADLFNIPIGIVKKLVPNFFDKEKYVLHYENLKFYLRLGLKLKKTLMSNAVYGKTMENLRNRINVKLVNNKKDYLK